MLLQVFPMNGTYFFQNEVFEDEGKGCDSLGVNQVEMTFVALCSKVTVPREALGPMHTVYIGRSVEGHSCAACSQ